jgi:hypothetical protein
MPNDEHVAMLGRGAAAWNAWRVENDEKPDLSRAGLRGLDLSGFDLSQADLRQADLRGTNLSQGEPVPCPPGWRELLQSGARWRQSCRGLLDWSEHQDSSREPLNLD